MDPWLAENLSDIVFFSFFFSYILTVPIFFLFIVAYQWNVFCILLCFTYWINVHITTWQGPARFILGWASKRASDQANKWVTLLWLFNGLSWIKCHGQMIVVDWRFGHNYLKDSGSDKLATSNNACTSNIHQWIHIQISGHFGLYLIALLLLKTTLASAYIF